MIETRQSFVFGTVLSSQQSINMMGDAKAAGFAVDLDRGVFPEEN